EHVVELRARVLVEVEKRRDGGGGERLGGERCERVLVDVERAPERLVEELGQAVLGSALPEARDEGLDLRAIELEGLPQKRERHVPSALLDEAQVRGRNPEPFGRLRLA